MNDYWNDPPDDHFEPPECCGDFMEVGDHGCWCPNCGGFTAFKVEQDYEVPQDTEPVWDDRMVNFPAKCPHGNEWFACDACDRASDFAYDSQREARFKR